MTEDQPQNPNSSSENKRLEIFSSVTERVIVGVLTTITLGAIYFLWDAITELRVGLGVPENAVLAFHDLSGCPSGWTDMGDEWHGRTLVAASQDANDTYAFGRTGGHPTHVLTLAQMPRHTHDILDNRTTTFGYGDGWDSPNISIGDENQWGEFHFPGRNAPTGGPEGADIGVAEPHNNMPPYIALYFCRRD